MRALTVTLTPIRFGWAVTLSDGSELARFIGPLARARALRYLSDRIYGSGRRGSR